MKKLTGRAAEDFADQSELDYHEFIKLPETCQNTLIIEWFDTVGIYISASSFNDLWGGYQRGFESEVYDQEKNIKYDLYSNNDVSETRTEAINAGIKKASELYNLNNYDYEN